MAHTHRARAGKRGARYGHGCFARTRVVDAGSVVSFSIGRSGRITRFPPQFGQTRFIRSAHTGQNVHS
jgi:hypothetical protein